MGVLPFSPKASSMEKQPVPTACFEDAFLDYLRLRFEFEPLMHYVMAAMNICDETGRDYPPFVRAFFTWFAEAFLFDRKGNMPVETNNADPADKRWRRYEDCHALLEGWHNDDLRAALEAQEERWELIERVTQLRSEPRQDPIGKAGRKRKKTTKTDAEVFAELEEWFAVRDYTLKRQHKKLTVHHLYMSGTFPVALVRSGNGYEVKCIQVDHPDAILLPEGKRLR